MVPSSITVHSGLATCWPMRPLNAETPLRLKSASRPWPTASCSRIPGQPGPSTTVISPAGASTASSCTIACRAASRAKCSGVFSFRKKSSVDAPAAAGMAVLRSAVALARQHRHAHPRHRLPVEAEAAFAGRDQHVAQAVGIGRLHLKHARIVGARGAIGALDQIDALAQARFRAGAVSIG